MSWSKNVVFQMFNMSFHLCGLYKNIWSTYVLVNTHLCIIVEYSSNNASFIMKWSYLLFFWLYVHSSFPVKVSSELWPCHTQTRCARDTHCCHQADKQSIYTSVQFNNIRFRHFWNRVRFVSGIDGIPFQESIPLLFSILVF